MVPAVRRLAPAPLHLLVTAFAWLVLLPSGAQAEDPPAKPADPAEGRPAAQPTATPPPTPPPAAPPAGPEEERKVAKLPEETGHFQFGSYGRVMASLDGRGGPGRDADITSHGSRLDEDSYAELEFRREDLWKLPGLDTVSTRVVATLAVGEPLFHSSGKFDAKLAVRNLYVEERDIGMKGLAAWVGSRMYRGDDAYLLNWWPLDNLNTVGGGLRLNLPSKTEIALHAGVNRLDDPFQYQTGRRALPNNQEGTTDVAILNRAKVIESLRVEQIFMLTAKAGLKAVGYGELHQIGSGQREEQPGQYQQMPSDSGYVAGLQLGAFTGERDSHVNLFLRYARGLAAFGGDLAIPTSFAADKTTTGASEFSVAFSGNYEAGPFALMAAGYVRTFRGASPDQFSYGNVDEGAIVVRPHVYFTDRVGVFVEGTYEALHRGVINAATSAPLNGSLTRFGVVPFLSPAGRGSYVRPQLRMIWLFTRRDEGARSFYASDDIFARRQVEQFFGLEAEWWFNSSYR
jgi:maltoporin